MRGAAVLGAGLGLDSRSLHIFRIFNVLPGHAIPAIFLIRRHFIFQCLRHIYYMWISVAVQYPKKVNRLSPKRVMWEPRRGTIRHAVNRWATPGTSRSPGPPSIKTSARSKRGYRREPCRALRPAEKFGSATVTLDVTDEPALVREMALAGRTGFFIRFESPADQNLADARKGTPKAVSPPAGRDLPPQSMFTAPGSQDISDARCPGLEPPKRLSLLFWKNG